MKRLLENFEIHGHRGCRGLMPENTIPAFSKAIQLGVDYLELDVVVSNDRKVVVSHEPFFNPISQPGQTENQFFQTTKPIFIS